VKAAQLTAFARRFAPLLISVGIALVFALAHITIESEAFHTGPLSDRGYLRLLDKKLLDLKFVGRELDDLPEPKVIIAAIDEKGLKKYGLWPWSRTVVAEFIRKTTRGGARVIAFDAIFADEDKNSSYLNIKRFVDEYERAGLRPEAERMVELRTQLEQALELQASVQKALKAVETRAKGPRKAQLKSAVAPAVKAAQKASRAVDQARSEMARLQESSRTFFQSMRGEVASASPDEALAHAVGESPQTILGFISYLREEEFEGIAPEQMKRNLELLEPCAIHGIYEMESYDYGDVVREVEGIDISQMWIHPIKGALAPLPMIAKRATAFGFFNASPDPDGQMRSIRLLHRHEKTLYPSLTLATVAKYFGAKIEPLNSQIFPGERLGGVSAGNGAIPTNMRGHFYLNYYEDPREYFETHSVADFIDGTVPPEEYEDKIVLFGMTGHGLKQDLRATPYSPATPGVYVHATAIQNILDQRYLERIFGIALVEALLYMLLGVVLGLLLPRIPAWAGVLVTIGFAVGLYMFDVFWMFPRGTWVMTVLPTLQAVTTMVGVIVHGYLTEGREKAKIRKAFQFYLTKSVVDEMLKDTTKLQLGGERRICTVLFSDIRGFTTISERLSPEELVSLLNSYLTPMTNLVFKYDGTLDKYMGDAIMAISVRRCRTTTTRHAPVTRRSR
jgi:adenylate cyclase